MQWFSTGLLIALTAGTAAWTAYLLRRLFVVEPAEPTTRSQDPDAGHPSAEEPNP